MQVQPTINPTLVRPWPIAMMLLSGLVALADLLIWQTGTPRLALAVFAIAVVAAAQLLAGRGLGAGPWCLAGADWSLADWRW